MGGQSGGSNFGTMAFQLGGTLIGSYFGGPIGGMIGGMAGGLIGGALFGKAKRPLINDTQLGNSSYGNPIPILYGTARLPGQMVWTTVPKVTGNSGKGGVMGSTPHVHQSAMFAFCEPGLGGSARMQTVWLDGKLFWQSISPNAETVPQHHTFLIREHYGDEEQQPDPDYAGWVKTNTDQPNAIPAYRGLCLLSMIGVDTINYGTRFPQVTATWSTSASPTVTMVPMVMPADVTSQAAPFVNPIGNAQLMAVDWVRGSIYTLSGDGTVRAWSITTRQLYAMITQAEYAAGTGSIFFAEDNTTISGITFDQTWSIGCGQGGGLYVVGEGSLGSRPWVAELDPNTLKPIRAQPTLQPHGGFNDEITVIQVAGAKGSAEILVFTGGIRDQVAFVAQPVAGYNIDLTIWPLGTFDAASWCVLDPPHCPDTHYAVGEPWGQIYVRQGAQDLVAGITEIWVCAKGGFAPDIYVYHYITDGFAVWDGSLVGTIPASAFGYAETDYGAPDFSFWYDLTDDGLVVYQAPGICKWSVDAGVIWSTVPAAGVLNNNDPGQMQVTNVGAGRVAFYNGSDQYAVVDSGDGAFEYYTLSGDGFPGVGRTMAFDGLTNTVALFGYPQNSIWIGYFGATSAAVAVADIIVDLCERVGMTVDMIDTAAVTQTVTGYVVRDTRSAGQALKELCDCFQIDFMESDWMLKFVPRGTAPVAALTEDKLASVDPQDASKHWETAEAPEQEMPLLVAVKYSDPALNFQPGSAYARRPALPGVNTMWAKRRLTIDLPICTDNQTARQLAENWLYTAWGERETYQTMLSPEYLWLDPTDNITVSMNNGDAYTVRIESIQTGGDYTLALQLASEDVTTYQPSTSPGATLQVPAPVIPGFVDLYQINVPLLQDSDDLGGTLSRIYFAALLRNGSFIGATAYKSTDGSNYIQTNGVAQNALYGTCQSVLGAPASLWATDWINTLTVSFPSGTTLPSSAAYVDMMNGQNAALVGQEIIQFTSVTDNADGSVTLSGLLRGLRGTDWAVGMHGANEVLLMLQAGQIGGAALALTEINQTERWKILQPGATLASQPTKAFAYLGYDLMPYSPMHVLGSYDGSNNIQLTWVRQTRIGGTTITDGTDTVPLGETTEAYSVDIMDAANATVKRTINGLTSPAATYTASQIAADFGSPPTTVWVKVFQISSVVGRGFSHDWHLDLAAGTELSDLGDAPPVAA